ncbi:MAG TPA: hypothetical protein VFV19_17085 [Candidatus Polarisedimenticolaceae bacterium]|nr:hypothetical protein [Candidatus Polarisedimenticolaceae bacterium]
MLAIMLCSMAVASPKLAVLDGTSWKVEVKPDSMAKDKAEQEFKETLTFADGNVTLGAAKVGGDPAPYTVSKTGVKDLTFTAERKSAGEGSSTWTGTVHGDDVDGTLVWIRHDGVVLTYTFKGSKVR